MSKNRPERAELLRILDENLGRRLSGQVVMFHQAVADQLGLNATDLKCLDLAREFSEPITAGQLADITGLTTAAITSVIDRLEKAGFVSREKDPSDRRKVIIQPVAGREHEVDQIFVSMASAMTQLYADYNDQELVVLSDFVVRVLDVLKKETASLRKSSESTKRLKSTTAG
jgi:DNA-binding MarR family transcriptional regulator